MSTTAGAQLDASALARRVTPIAIGATIAAYVAVYVSWTLVHWSGDRTVVSDLAPIPLALAATVLAWRTAHDPSVPARRRSAWVCLAFGCLTWTLAECLWFFFEVVRNTSPFPSPADWFYLAFYAFAFAGLVRLPVRALSRKERVAFALDLATVMFVTLMAVWYLVVDPTVRGTQALLDEVLSLAYPVGDVILVLGVARVLVRRRAGNDGHLSLWLLGCGAMVLAVADVAYARLELSHSYRPGTLPDALWVCALAAFALAAVAEVAPRRDRVELDDGPEGPLGVSKLPYLAVVIGLALVLNETSRDVGGPLSVLVLGALGLTVIVVLRQVTVQRDNEHLVTELHRLAHTDALTGLPNRRQLFELAPRLVATARAAERTVTVVVADVDNFKAINDAFGHAAGDEVLRVVAARCTGALRPRDLLARFGGDELVAVITGDADTARREIASRLSQAVARDPVATAVGPIPVTLSVGVATSATAGLDRLLQDADGALLRVKRSGRPAFDPPLRGWGTAGSRTGDRP